MTDTLRNIKLPANTWVNLYVASGVTVGTQITVKNLSTVQVKLNVKATSPTQTDARSDESGAYTALLSYGSATNQSNDSGAWAWAYAHSDGLVSVKVY